MVFFVIKRVIVYFHYFSKCPQWSKSAGKSAQNFLASFFLQSPAYCYIIQNSVNEISPFSIFNILSLK